MLKIKLNREYKICNTSEKGDEDFYVKFKFQPTEDLDLTEVRKKFEDSKDVVVKNLSVFDVVIRKSIIDTDIVDVDTDQIIPIKNEDGSINEYNQKIVMDVIKMFPDFYNKVWAAYLGPQGKNL
jgi:hypothetical protein